MKYILSVLFLFFFVSAFSQVYQEMPQYGYRANRFAFDSTLQIPTTCGVPTLKSVISVNKKSAIAFDSCNNRLYYYNPSTLTWQNVTGASGFDSTSLSNRINLKIDSLKRSNDSVFAYKNGIRYYQFKDTVGNAVTIDTTSLSNRINTKFAIADTGNKWVNSVAKVNDTTIRVIKNTTTTDIVITGRVIDTLSLSNRINTKFAIADTGNKWVNSVTKLNDSTIRVIKNTTTSDLLIRGNPQQATGSNGLSGTSTITLGGNLNNGTTAIESTTDGLSSMTIGSTRKLDAFAIRNNQTTINSGSDIFLIQPTAGTDTTTYKPLGVASNGKISRINNWFGSTATTIDTTNKFVNAVTKINDSTIRVFKGSTSTDLLIRGNSTGSGTTPSLQDVTTVGATTSDKITMSQPLTGLTNEFNAVTGTRISIINSFIESVGHIELNYLSDYNTEFFNPSLVMAGEGAHPTTNIILRTDEILLQNPVKGIVSLKMQDTTEQPNLYFPRGDTQIDTLATLRDVRAGGGSSGTVTNVATGYGLSGGPITNTGTLIADTSVSGLSGKYLRITDTTGKWASASGYVPYVGATTDLDMGVHQVNAQSFYANGSNGNGHIHLKHQNSDATGQGQTTTIFADANGDFKWKNAGNFYTTLKTSGNAANAIYTFPSATTRLIGAGDTATMLTPYLRSNIAAATYLAKTDTASLSSRINLKVNIADTSSMLTPYIRLAGTGLTKSSQTLSNNLSTGVSGGQSVVGGTAASNSLTLSSTSNATKGKLLFGTSAYDEVNNRLGIGTATPATDFHLSYSNNAYGQGAIIQNTNTGTTSITGLLLRNSAGTDVAQFSFYPSNYLFAAQSNSVSFGSIGQQKLSFGANTSSNGAAAQDIVFSTLGTNSTYQMQIKGNGNVQIGTNTDAGYKLDVNGTARVQGALNFNPTNTAAGTTGNQTINKPSGTVNIAAAGTTVTVTNSLVSATSIVYAVIRTNDATATIKNVVPAAGSFVINLGAAATAEVSIGFFVIN